MIERIGFIGLGALGLPLATNLIDAGYSLTVYNRTLSKADPLVAQGAQLAMRPVDAVSRGGIVVTMVWDDAAVEGIVTSEGFLQQLGPDGIHVSMSTISPDTAKRMAGMHAEHGGHYVEAPVFGTPDAAAAKQLWIPMAGQTAAKRKVEPLLKAMGAQGIFDFGESVGAATLVKLIGNFLIISASRSMKESLLLASNQGVDPKAVADMLTSTLFAAPIYQAYAQRLLRNMDVLSRSKIPAKDMGLFVDAAKKVDTPTPIANFLRESLLM